MIETVFTTLESGFRAALVVFRYKQLIPGTGAGIQAVWEISASLIYSIYAYRIRNIYVVYIECKYIYIN